MLTFMYGSLIGLMTIFLFIGGARWMKETSSTENKAEKKSYLPAINWKAGARAATILVGCHLLIWYFWPELWSKLAGQFVFWMDHAILLLAFLFLREANKKGKEEFVAGTSWLLTILVLGNIWMLWGWTENQYATARAKALAERQQLIAAEQAARQAEIAAMPTETVAPVGRPSERIIITPGTIIKGEPGKLILFRDDKDRLIADNGDGKMKLNQNGEVSTALWVTVQSGTTEEVKITISR